MKSTKMLVILLTILAGPMAAAAGSASDAPRALQALVPAGAKIVQVTPYDIRGVGQKDDVVFYEQASACGVVLASKDHKALWSFRQNGAAHVWLPAGAHPGVVALDPAHPAVPYLVFNPYFDAVKSQFHVFRWAGKGFTEIQHADLGDNPQVALMPDKVPAVVVDNFGYPTPHLFVLKNDRLVPADYQYPHFFDKTVKEAEQSLHDIQMIPHPDYLEVESKYLAAFAYAHRCQEGLKFADKVLGMRPTGLGRDLSSRAAVEIHHQKGCLYLEMGKEAEGMAEFKIASALDERPEYQGQAGVYVQLGDYYTGKNDGARAVAAYETARNFAPQGDTRVALALQGDVQEAAQEAGLDQNALQVSPEGTVDLQSGSQTDRTMVVSSLPQN